MLQSGARQHSDVRESDADGPWLQGKRCEYDRSRMERRDVIPRENMYRNGVKITTTANDGRHTDETGNKGKATHQYQGILMKARPVARIR